MLLPGYLRLKKEQPPKLTQEEEFQSFHDRGGSYRIEKKLGGFYWFSVARFETVEDIVAYMIKNNIKYSEELRQGIDAGIGLSDGGRIMQEIEGWVEKPADVYYRLKSIGQQVRAKREYNIECP